jgi:hypothetical protein
VELLLARLGSGGAGQTQEQQQDRYDMRTRMLKQRVPKTFMHIASPNG